MLRIAPTLSMVPELVGGPFIFSMDAKHACRVSRDLGYHAMELFPRTPEALNRELLDIVKGHDLAVSAVGTGAAKIVHQLSISDSDPEIRRKGIEFIKQLIGRAATVAAPVIVGSVQGRAGAQGREEALKWLADSLNALGAKANQEGFPLLYESLNRYETDLFVRVGDAADFVRRNKIEGVKVLCDLFHMNIEEASIPKAFEAVGNLVGHVHFADSNRRAPGWGHTSFAEIADVLDKISYNGFLGVECFPDPTPEATVEKTIETYREYFQS